MVLFIVVLPPCETSQVIRGIGGVPDSRMLEMPRAFWRLLNLDPSGLTRRARCENVGGCQPKAL